MAAPLRSAGRALFAAYEFAAMLLGLGMLAAICLAWAPLALPLGLLLPAAWGRRVGRLAVMHSFRFYLWFLTVFCCCRFDLDALRRDAPLIVVANHPSLLDAVILLSRFPDMACVMKAALAGSPLFGAGARLARYICNDVPLEVILRAREELRGGGQVLLFPEGTRTTRWPIDPLIGSAGLISGRTGVPVQTLLIEFSTPYLGKDWPLFRRPPLPLCVRVRVGRRFAPPQDVPAFTRELEQYFRDELTPGASPAAEGRAQPVRATGTLS